MTYNDPFGEWDAAYVLGALSPSERREYEEHLAVCAECSAAVGELAGVPGLLARVPDEEVLPPESPQASGPAVTSLPRLLAAARRSRMRRRAWTVAATVAVAACAATVALVVAPLVTGTPEAPQATVVALSRVVPSTLSADVRLVPEPWGTRIESNCHYGGHGSGPAVSDPAPPSQSPPGSGYGDGAIAYAMYVTDRSGAQTRVSTWLAQPGGTVTPTATTSLPLVQIAAVDIRTVSTGQVVLRSNVG